jgi:Histone chaperone domain CHZ/Centromere protein B dimerisation domain
VLTRQFGRFVSDSGASAPVSSRTLNGSPENKGKGKGKAAAGDSMEEDEEEDDEDEEEDEDEEDEEMDEVSTPLFSTRRVATYSTRLTFLFILCIFFQDDSLEEIDPGAILPSSGRRTRGVKIDYTSKEALEKAGLKPETGDEEEDSYTHEEMEN